MDLQFLDVVDGFRISGSILPSFSGVLIFYIKSISDSFLFRAIKKILLVRKFCIIRCLQVFSSREVPIIYSTDYARMYFYSSMLRIRSYFSHCWFWLMDIGALGKGHMRLLNEVKKQDWSNFIYFSKMVLLIYSSLKFEWIS